MSSVLVPIDQIVIGDRVRKDMGDLDEFAASIQRNGLLQPVLVTQELLLVVGHRRIEAHKRLGRSEIPAIVVNLEDLLSAQRDENAIRKDFTPTEAVALGRLIEEEHRAKIAAQKSEMGQRNVAYRTDRRSTRDVNQHVVSPLGKTVDVAARAVGMGPQKYEQAKVIVAAAEADPEKFGDLPVLMDETGNVSGTHRELEHRRNGTSARHAIHHKRHVPKANDIVRRAVSSLEGICAGLGEVRPQDVDAAEAPAWRSAIEGAANALRRFARGLK